MRWLRLSGWSVATRPAAGVFSARLLGKQRTHRRATSARAVVLVACIALALAAVASGHGPAPCWLASNANRRGLVASVAAATLGLSTSDSAEAFPNAVKQINRYMNSPKKKGPMPQDLGLDKRYPGDDFDSLKPCTNNAPNCLSTTFLDVDVGRQAVTPWRFTGKLPANAMNEVLEVVKAYQPGQQGIDGGGFDIKVEDVNRCIYVQYESLKQGHIDDVEFCLDPANNPGKDEGKILWRSSSRLGYYDYGVNAARMNEIARMLSEKGGWTTVPVDREHNKRYWDENCIGGDAWKKAFVTRDKFPDKCIALAPIVPRPPPESINEPGAPVI